MDSYEFDTSFVRLQIYGMPPPLFADTILAPWVWKGFVCFETVRKRFI